MRREAAFCRCVSVPSEMLNLILRQFRTNLDK